MYHTAHLRGVLQPCNQRRCFLNFSKPWRPLAGVDHSSPFPPSQGEEQKLLQKLGTVLCLQQWHFLRAHGLFENHVNPWRKWSSQVKCTVTLLTWMSMEISLALGNYHSSPERWRVKRAGWSERGRGRQGKQVVSASSWCFCSNWCFSSKTCSGPADKLLFSSEY